MYDTADRLALSFADVEAYAASLGAYDAATKRLTVEGIIFDLNDRADAAFFAELSFVHTLVAQLKADEYLRALVADKASDFFTFAFNFHVSASSFFSCAYFFFANLTLSAGP